METPLLLKNYSTPAVWEDFLKSQSDPQWLRQAREQAFASYNSLPWPSTSMEEWRRTNVSQIAVEEFGYLGQPGKIPHPDEDAPAAMVEQYSGLIRFSGCDCEEIYLNTALADKGVIFTTLADAARRYPTLVAQYFMHNVPPTLGKFEALQASLVSHGVFLYLPKFLEIGKPFAIIFQETGHRRLSCPQVLAVLAPGARCILTQELSNLEASDAVICNAVVSLYLSDAAGIKYISTQELNHQSFYFMNGCATLGRDAQLHSLQANFGSALTKSRFGSILEQPGAVAKLQGVYFAKGSQHFDLRTVQHHQVPFGKTDVLYKGVVKDQARTIYQGLIKVFPNAQKTDAYQSNKNLVLSETARADSLPSLEIEANDLRCTHGSTVGKLDEQEVFYLMARGLPRLEAQKIIITGFFEEILGQIPEDIAEKWRSSIEKKLS